MTHATAVQLIFFKTNKIFSSDVFSCSFFGLKNDKFKCFGPSSSEYIELFKNQCRIYGKIQLRWIFQTVEFVKKVSWFLKFIDIWSFCQHGFIKKVKVDYSPLLIICADLVRKVCLYLYHTILEYHRLFSCFGGAWAVFG